MHIIAQKTVKQFSEKHADARSALADWLDKTEAAEWQSIVDVRRVFPNADAVTVTSGKIVTVFNVKGNEYRLIVAIHYNRQKVYTLEFMTHAEYDKEKWKRRL